MFVWTKSVVILAFNDPKKFEADKGTLLIDGKALFSRVVDAVEEFADEIIVVTASQQQTDLYRNLCLLKCALLFPKTPLKVHWQ